jgi:hypothetical protein
LYGLPENPLRELRIQQTDTEEESENKTFCEPRIWIRYPWEHTHSGLFVVTHRSESSIETGTYEPILVGSRSDTIT